MAGVDDVYLLDHAIAVPVVLAEINLVIYHLYGFCNHNGRVLVVANLVVGTIVFEGLTHDDRANDIKGEIELPIAGIEEVVVDGTYVDVVGITGIVELVLKVLVSVVKWCLGKLNQNDQSALAACHGLSCVLPASCAFP